MGEWSSLPLMVAAVFVVIDLLTTQNCGSKFVFPRMSRVKAAYDVVVVGAGVVGAATAWAAARSGAKVCLLEQFQRAHDRGSSHGDGRIYRFAYAEDHYARMMHGALRGWKEVQEITGSKNE